MRSELEAMGAAGDAANLVEYWLHEGIENIDEFRALVDELLAEAESSEGLLSSIVKEVTAPEVPPDVTQVRIMSLHKSKGLSSPVVVIAGCVEGLLPTAPDSEMTPMERTAHLEEQRRLLYVGITRVKDKPEEDQPGVLLLTYSRTMPLADAMQSGIAPARVEYATAYVNASRFIRELGPAAPAPRAR